MIMYIVLQNHVAETCTNKYIPDHGNFVYRSAVNPTKDPTLSEFKRNLVSHYGTTFSFFFSRFLFYQFLRDPESFSVNFCVTHIQRCENAMLSLEIINHMYSFN